LVVLSNVGDMAQAKLSGKYQIVIPKELRDDLRQGQMLKIDRVGPKEWRITSGSVAEEYTGALKGVYSDNGTKDPMEYLKALRAEWRD
jgi:hypothetical protein